MGEEESEIAPPLPSSLLTGPPSAAPVAAEAPLGFARYAGAGAGRVARAALSG